MEFLSFQFWPLFKKEVIEKKSLVQQTHQGDLEKYGNIQRYKKLEK